MKKILLQLKQYKGAALLLVPLGVLALGVVFKTAFNVYFPARGVQSTTEISSDPQNEISKSKTADQSPLTSAPQATAPAGDGKNKFSYQAEAASIAELKEQLPQSKPRLLEIIVKKDTFKNTNTEVKAHSINEITQNQMGAVKVLALRALMTAKTDDETLKRDLDYVIQKAKDPTIVKIAKAARESVDKGRSFFDDFVDGIASM